MTDDEIVAMGVEARREARAEERAAIVAMLETGRAPSGEVIMSARHAAVIVKRGDHHLDSSSIADTKTIKPAPSADPKCPHGWSLSQTHAPICRECKFLPDREGERE